jgi:hypothetical protein
MDIDLYADSIRSKFQNFELTSKFVTLFVIVMIMKTEEKIF